MLEAPFLASNDLPIPFEYERTVEARLKRLEGTSPTWTLQALLPHMRGVPPEVLARYVPVLTHAAMQTDERSVSRSTAAFEPHPLDYDWRFLPGTVSKIHCFLDTAPADARIVLLGAPTLFGPLRSKRSAVELLDRNPAIPGTNVVDITEVQSSYFCPEPAVVFLDPPWYLSDMAAWLNFAASRFAKIHLLAFSLWPELTRPSAQIERLSIMQWAASFGRVKLLENFLEYDVPEFERRAYLQRGIALNSAWRAGDLVLLKPSRDLAPMSIKSPSSRKAWTRFLIGKRQIAVQEDSNSSSPALLPIGSPPSWHFDTVSRRDPRRQAIQLWTSNNVVAKVEGARTFVNALTQYFGAQHFAEPNDDERNALAMLEQLGCIKLSNAGELMIWRHRD